MALPRVDKHDQGYRIAETILVGCMLKSPHDDRLDDHLLAERVAESGVKGDWFEDASYGAAFDDLMLVFRRTRDRVTPEEAARAKVQEGNDPNDATSYAHFLVGCKAAQQMRRLNADLLVREVKNRHRKRLAARLYEDFLNACQDGVAEDAINAFRERVMRELSDPGNGVIHEHDLMDECDEVMSWIVDMKRNPEKYRGYECGMQAIDARTNGGFRPGHLTVFVGKPGGYKSRMLVNIAYGLWRTGHDVLYASLEMEPKLLEAMLLCRASYETQKYISYTRILQGCITEKDDPKILDETKKEMEEIVKNLGPKGAEFDEGFRRLKSQAERIVGALQGADTTEEGWDDVSRLKAAKQMLESSKKNRLRIINVGQSKKIRLSQIERYIEENQHEFKPQIVIIDYLTMVGPETPRNDRRDLELGEICEYMRSMGEHLGLHVITAAQLRRAAIERIRKFGNETPEKANLSTDDVSDSNQIPATADTLFILWPMPSEKLKIMCVKARHAQPDYEGCELYVNNDCCMIGDTNTSHVAVGNPYEIKASSLTISFEDDLGPRSDSDVAPTDTGQGEF